MKGGRRKREKRFFRCTIFLVFSCVFFIGFIFSSFRIFYPGIHPVLLSSWQSSPAIEAISSNLPVTPAISIRETVVFPDQAVIFLKYPPSFPLYTKDDLYCLYFSPNSSQPHLKLPPTHIDSYSENPANQIIRCPLQQGDFTVSIAMKSNGAGISPGPTHRWDSLVYEALIDRDNTTIVFVKGLNLRPERVSDPTRFECVYGLDFRRQKFLLRSDVISVAQEIVRCKTPRSILSTLQRMIYNNYVKVSIRVKGRGILRSTARPEYHSYPDLNFVTKEHEMCICTMVRNQARFLREWVMYHARLGVQRWYIYDNNSEDNIVDVIKSLEDGNFEISRHVWPWIKTQEAGFAHCALQARDKCKWVGFIDVDEFFHFPSGLLLYDVLRNQSISKDVGELRTSCHNFGPSGLKTVPIKGVMVGYTCRLHGSERHKSIVKPEALNDTLINVVHHFHLKGGFESLNVDTETLVINHYKYQVWEVFKEKFYRRVATYVADWQAAENVGSRDRAPGLGTRAVEPPDWSRRFCEVVDTGLKDRVLRVFRDPITQMLPWQEQQDDGEVDEEQKHAGEVEEKQKNTDLGEHHNRRRRKKRKRREEVD